MPACRALWSAVGMMLSLSSAPVLANEPASDNPASTNPAPPQAVIVPGFGTTLAVDTLDRYRGGDDAVQNHVDIRGQLDNNTAHDIVSGDNTLSGGSFANASGIFTAIQNSGSNVLIQNGMVVNVQFAGSGP